jgi:AcrR family transcriptional regulator
MIDDNGARPGQRRKGRPNLAETADIERAIRAAALDVLIEHGEAATLNAVAQAAGISRKSLYARYHNKADLFIDVICGLMDEADTITFAASGRFEQDLYAFIRRMIDIISDGPSVTIQRLLEIDPAYIRALRPQMRTSANRLFEQPLANLLRDAANRGEIVSGDADITARTIVKLVFAETHSFGTERDAPRSDRWQEHYAAFLSDFICKGLLPRPPA